MECTKFLLQLDQMQGVYERAMGSMREAHPRAKAAEVGAISTDIGRPRACRFPKSFVTAAGNKDGVWILQVFNKKVFWHYVFLVYRHDSRTMDWVDSVGLCKAWPRRQTNHQYEDPVFRKWYKGIHERISGLCAREGIRYNGYKYNRYRPQALEMGLTVTSVETHGQAPGKCYLWAWHITEEMLRRRISFAQWHSDYLMKNGKLPSGTRKFIKRLVYRIYRKFSVPMMRVGGRGVRGQC